MEAKTLVKPYSQTAASSGPLTTEAAAFPSLSFPPPPPLFWGGWGVAEKGYLRPPRKRKSGNPTVFLKKIFKKSINFVNVES